MKPSITLLTLGLTLATPLLKAQAPAWEWTKGTGGSASDISTCVSIDGSGNTYVGGQFSSSTITFGSTNLTNSGGIDMFLVKYDPAGNVLWAKSGTGASNDGAYNIKADAAGNVYMVGTTNSSVFNVGGTALALHGYDDAFIIKFDPSGNVLWAKENGGSANDIGAGIAIDPSGNSYITGYFASSSIAFGSTTLTNAGGNDLFIAKYDPTGNVLWAKKAGGSANDAGTGIAADASGNSYVTGSYASSSIAFGSSTLNNTGAIDLFTVKYDPSGNVLWAGSATGASNDVGYNITLDATGNPYVVGTTNSAMLTVGSTALALNGYDDVFIIKYNASGAVTWAKENGGTGNDVGTGITVDGSGNAFITGYFASSTIAFGSTTLSNIGTNNIFAAAYDASGNILWAKSAGGTSDDRGSNIATDPTGNNYVVGSFSSASITFGSPLTNAGGNDMYVAKLGGSTGILEVNNQQAAFSVFPNPGNGTFTVEVTKNLAEAMHISITNLLGQAVYEATPDTQTSTVRLEQPGVYVVRVQQGAQSSTKKVIVN